MTPQGTANVNTGYIDNLTAQINAIQGTAACADLQKAVNAASASIEAELSAIRSQIAALAPIITIPAANPGAIVAWITSLVSPQITAYNNYVAQLSATLAAVARLETAIGAAAARLTSCTITIPPMS
jgi:hypothetical protein